MLYYKIMSALAWLGIGGQIGKHWKNGGHSPSPSRHGKLENNSLPSLRQSDSRRVGGKHRHRENLSLPSGSSDHQHRLYHYEQKRKIKPTSPGEASSRWPGHCHLTSAEPTKQKSLDKDKIFSRIRVQKAEDSASCVRCNTNSTKAGFSPLLTAVSSEP